MSLAKRIKLIRLNRGETLEEFGKHFGVLKSVVWNWEAGRNKPNKENLKLIAEVENISVDELLNGSGNCMNLTDIEKKIIEQYRLGADIEIKDFATTFTYEEATDFVKEFGEIGQFISVDKSYSDGHHVIVRSNYEDQVQVVVSFEG